MLVLEANMYLLNTILINYYKKICRWWISSNTFKKIVILVCQISLIIRSAWNTITCSTITINQHTGSKRLQKISLTNEQKAKFQLCMRVCFWITGGLVCHLKGHKNSDLRSMSIIPNMQKLHFPKTLFQVELFYEIYWLNWLRLLPELCLFHL